MRLRTLIGAAASLAYILTLPSLVEATSMKVAALPAIALLVWVSADDIIEALPRTSTLLTLLTIAALAAVGALFVGQQTAGLARFVGYAIGIGGGVVGFVIGNALIRHIAASVLGFDLEQHERQKRRRRTNDPYGDKHAAEILDEQ